MLFLPEPCGHTVQLAHRQRAPTPVEHVQQVGQGAGRVTAHRFTLAQGDAARVVGQGMRCSQDPVGQRIPQGLVACPGRQSKQRRPIESERDGDVDCQRSYNRSNRNTSWVPPRSTDSVWRPRNRQSSKVSSAPQTTPSV